jgi:hypothetical protein
MSFANGYYANNQLPQRLRRHEIKTSRKRVLDYKPRLSRKFEVFLSFNSLYNLLTRLLEMNDEERTSILSAPEFHDFVDWSTKIMQRALNDNYDPARGYVDGAESVDDDSEGKRVKRVCAFYDERYGKNRSITDVDWSPKVGFAFLIVPIEE